MQNTNSDIAKATNGYSYLQLLWKAALKLILKSIEKNCTQKQCRITEYWYADSWVIST